MKENSNIRTCKVYCLKSMCRYLRQSMVEFVDVYVVAVTWSSRSLWVKHGLPLINHSLSLDEFSSLVYWYTFAFPLHLQSTSRCSDQGRCRRRRNLKCLYRRESARKQKQRNQTGLLCHHVRVRVVFSTSLQESNGPRTVSS